jgi:DNA-binding MarR family transcriptional regulator
MDAFLAMQNLVNTHHQMVVKDRSEAGAQPSQAACLRLLATTDGLSQRDIADAMRISRARVTYIVQAMEKAGTVHRVRDGGDQRLTRVYLTDLGREIDRGMGSVREDHINEMFRDMSEEDQIELTRWLDDLSARLKRAMHSGSPKLPGPA